MKKIIFKKVFAFICALAMVITSLISTPVTANAATLTDEQVANNTAFRQAINTFSQTEGCSNFTFDYADTGIFGKQIMLTYDDATFGRRTKILFSDGSGPMQNAVKYSAETGALVLVNNIVDGYILNIFKAGQPQEALWYYTTTDKYVYMDPELGQTEATDPTMIALFDSYFKTSTTLEGKYPVTDEYLNKYLPIVQTTKTITAVCYGEKDGNGNPVPLNGAEVSLQLCNDKLGSGKELAKTAIGTATCEVYYNGDKFVFIDDAGVASEYTYLRVVHNAPKDSIYEGTNVITAYTVADISGDEVTLSIPVRKAPVEVVRAETDDYVVYATYLNGGENYRDTVVSYFYENEYSDEKLLEALSKLTAEDTVVYVDIYGVKGELPTLSDAAMKKMATLEASLYMFIEETGEDYFCEKVEYTKPAEPEVNPLFPTGEYTLNPITLNVGGAFALKQSDLDKLISNEVVEMNGGIEKLYFGDAIKVDGDSLAQTLKYCFYATDLKTVVHEGHWTAEESQAFLETGVDGKWYYEGQEVIPVEEAEGVAFFVMRADKAGTSTVTIPEYKIGNTTIKLVIPFVVEEIPVVVPPVVEKPVEPVEVPKEVINEAKDTVENIINSSADVETKKDAIVETVKKEVMVAAMQKDEEFVATITKLEDDYVAEKGIIVNKEATVAPAVKDVIKGNVEVVGAGLNAEAGNTVRLDVAKPEKPVAVDTVAYKNAVQVDIKLLVNEAAKEELDVPVAITMDVPAGVSTNNLVILHYHGNDAVPSIIRPEVNGGSITFAVDKFSTFVFANEEPEASGVGTYYTMNPYAPSTTVLSPKTGDAGYMAYIAVICMAVAVVLVVKRNKTRV